MPKYFDVHSHLNSPEYEDDLDEVIGRLKTTETNTIVIGTDLGSSRRAVELAEKYEGIYASVGVHPVNNMSTSWEVDKFNKLVSYRKVVAIGECGFDFWHADKETDYARQEKLFLDQINFALEHDKPLMIHARNAYQELLEILEPLKREYRDKLRGNVHFFAGDMEVAQRLFDMNFTISFTGVITFARDYDEVIRRSPLNMIMSETDSPYVTPVPYRGKRNEPVYVSEVVKSIARIREEDEVAVRVALAGNAVSMIG